MIIDNPIVTGSLNVQNGITASSISIASTASAAYFTGSFVGDGTQLSGVTSYTDADTLDYINSLGVLSGSAQIASDISGSFTSLSSSFEQRITLQESFSSSLDATFATDQELSSVSGALAASIAGISTDFVDITNKPTLVSSSLQFNSFDNSFTGSYTGSFAGDGSNLTNITVSQVNTVTASFLNTGSVTIPHSFNSKNVSVAVYDDSDILIIPQEIALVSNNAVKLTFGGNTSGFAVVSKGGHILSGSVLVPQVSTVTDSFTSATSHTVTHNFNTKDVIVSVYEGDTYIIPDSITTPTLNTVTVTFPEPVTGRVVVVKAGHIVSGSIPFDNITLNPFVQGNLAVTASKHIVPSLDQTYDLGSPTLRFRDLYLSSASIFLGNTVISEDNVVTTASLASVLPDNVVSSSAQIASDISGSFTLVSESIASDISLNASSINSLNSASSSYATINFVTSSYLPLSGGNITGNFTVDTNTLYVDATGNNVGIGTTNLGSKLNIGGPNSFGQVVTQFRNPDLIVEGKTSAYSGIQMAEFSAGWGFDILQRGKYSGLNRYGVSNAGFGAIEAYGSESKGIIIGTVQNTPIIFGTNSAGRLRIDSDGLKFGTDTAAANALDDYEEGTWTPLPAWGPSQGTSTYTSAGFYTKIGNVVHVYGRVGITSIGNATGNFTIVGLPFAASNLYGGSPVYLLLGGVTATSPIQAYIEAGTTFVSFEQTNNGTQSPLTHANVTTGDFVYVRATYTV